jgi:hypothetical protein
MPGQMSVGTCIILAMTTYNKYTWVCTGDCDALIEYTFKDGYGWPNGVMSLTCPCNSNCTLLSVVDATIQPTNERNNMEETFGATVTSMAPDTYNPNLLVTYKKIFNGEATYSTDKVVDIEWTLDGARRSQERAQTLQSTIEEIKSFMTDEGWYNPNTEASEILTELERILDFNPTKTIEFTGTISFSGTVEIPLNEAEDFDLFYHLQDNLTLDAYAGDIEIDSYEVDRADEN